jgi:hypothetical protein
MQFAAARLLRFSGPRSSGADRSSRRVSRAVAGPPTDWGCKAAIQGAAAHRRIRRATGAAPLAMESASRNRKFESSSLQQTVRLSPAAAFEGREPRFSARVWAAGLATGSAETRQVFHCGPTGGNISVGPYSSTAVPLRWSAKMPRRSRQSWVFSAVNVRVSLNSDRAYAKPSTIR